MTSIPPPVAGPRLSTILYGFTIAKLPFTVIPSLFEM